MEIINKNNNKFKGIGLFFILIVLLLLKIIFG